MALTRPKYSNIVDSDYKQSCRVVTTTNINLAGGAPNNYDGVSLAIGSRILVAAQNTASENGIYTVQVVGTGSNGTWVRAFDANDGSRLTSGTQVAIGEGTDAGKIYLLATADPITVGSTDLNFVYRGGNPGGANATVQFNNLGSLGGSSAFTFNSSNSTVLADTLEVGNLFVRLSAPLAASLSTSGNLLASNINTSGTANIGTLAVSGTAKIVGNLTVGNLLVTGSTTQINSSILQVDDLNITVANGAVNSAAANGAGLTVAGAGATILYTSATDSWNFNKQTIGQFTTSNLQATGGSLTGVTGAASTLVATNFSTGNAQITGGSLTGVTGAATTLVATNFSSANAEITGPSSHIGTDTAGAVSRVANVYATLGNFDNFSTANAVITGGSITGVTGAASTFTATNFSTANLRATGTASATENLVINSTVGGAEGGQLVLAWKTITGITGQSNSTWNIDVNADNNLRIFYVDASGGAAVPFVISQPGQIVTAPNISSSNVLLGGGTSTVAPLTFTSGTNLTAPAAGAIEYDGKVFYTTPLSGERGVSPSQQMFVLNADRGLSTALTTQTLFNVNFDVSSNTRYYYQAYISISKTNATANFVQYAMAVATTAIASHQYSAMTKWAAARTTITALNQMSNRVTTNFGTGVTITANSAAAAATLDAHIQGYLDITTGGTINPQIIFGGAITAPTLLAQSYFLLYPVGPISANTLVQ